VIVSIWHCVVTIGMLLCDTLEIGADAVVGFHYAMAVAKQPRAMGQSLRFLLLSRVCL